MFRRGRIVVAMALTLGVVDASLAGEASRLRLVPFPKQVNLRQGVFPLEGKSALEGPGRMVRLFGEMIGAELQRAGLPEPVLHDAGEDAHWVRLSASPGGKQPEYHFRDQPTPEDYTLEIQPEAIVCGAPGDAGLFYGVQTLCQLIRANRRDQGLPCAVIRDWPSLRWRCYQDDLTRGPSSTLDTLKLEVALGAYLKMNLFTYYMEYQYAFKKHPIIGPKDGSLTPEDLSALVGYAKRLQVDILGNQQSFGHFTRILQHPEYAHLRETPDVLCPVKEETYQLLDDLYSEVCPILPFEMFNACCDETYGLGKGPAKDLVEKLGSGNVYVGHIRRVYDLLKGKYKKRMMMWGDIILEHPLNLPQVPKDIVMLTFGYTPRGNFEDQIIPFARSGYGFFVCPGISNWSRILPDFGTASINIRHFVRDGAKHGALGMLNTAWEDDGESLQGYKWHGYAWGAECAWNASTTAPEDFNRRIGAVLFGEEGDHFGRAIELLAQTHRLPDMDGMYNKRFWLNDFKPRESAAATRASAERLLGIVRPAREHLKACKKEATVNAKLLDYFLFGAERIELIGQRMLDGLQAAEAYTEAYHCAREDKEKARSLLAKAEKLVHDNRDAYEALGRKFERLWLDESKPYALDWTMDRYAGVAEWYDGLAQKLAEARTAMEAGKPLPQPKELGLDLP